MAKVTRDPTRKRWLIVPADIGERSALLKLPSRKWMTQMGLVVVNMVPANARILKEYLTSGVLREDSIGREFENSVLEMLKPARTDRRWPTWYAFNNKKFSPMDHQVDALKRLYPTHAGALFMKMGTAKTRVAIDLCTAHFYEKRIRFVIVVCPLTVKMSTWVDELENFSPCPYNFIDVDADYIASSFRPLQDRLQWLVVGIESLSQGKTFKALEPVTRLGVPYAVVVDESSRIANYKTICTQATYSLRKRAVIRLIMTGSEIKKSMEDLYSQFEFLDPNIIGCGDYFAFRNRYCIMGGYKGKDIVGYDNVDELMGLATPHVFQAEKSILNLPPKLYEKRIVKLTPEQMKVYRSIKKGEQEDLNTTNILTKTLRLQQVACGFYNTDRFKKDPITGKKTEVPVRQVEIIKPSSNPKLRELINLAKEVSDPMIIWVQSMYEYAIITEALGKLGEVMSIIGATPKLDRGDIVRQFQVGNIPFFVGTEAAGGIGITLTAATTVVYFSSSTRFGDRVQSEDRAHRKGQKKSVTIVDLVAEGTVDLSVLANHAEKIDIATYVSMALRDRIALDRFFDGEVDQQVLTSLAHQADRNSLTAIPSL